MASKFSGQLVKAGLYLGGGYVLYKMADNGTIGGEGGFPQKVAEEIKKIFQGATGGAGAAASGTQPAGTLGPATNATAGAGNGSILPFRDPAQLTADAMSKGIRSATDPGAAIYGRTLFAIQHGNDPSGYDSLSGADQVTWNSVAITGH